MKRYLIFAVVAPFVGGFLMLLATTLTSGYWVDTNLREIGKFLGAFFRTLQYSYLFGIVWALMVGAIDDILYHVRRIGPVLRMLIVGITWPFTNNTLPSRPFSKSRRPSMLSGSGRSSDPSAAKRLSKRISSFSGGDDGSGSSAARTMTWAACFVAPMS